LTKGIPTGKLASKDEFGKDQSMDIESLKNQLQLMEILVDGCKKHPAYRAIRPATGNCEPCVKMWNARRELQEKLGQNWDKNKKTAAGL